MKKSLVQGNRIVSTLAIPRTLPLVLTVMWAINSCPIVSANSAARPQSAGPTVSPVHYCKPGSDEPLGKKKSSSPKNKSRTPVSSVESACIEIHQPALLIQEFLQRVVRDLRWAVTDEQATEDFWSFCIAIDAKELAAYTKPSPEQRISWSTGKASVNVRTSELMDGYTRVVITAQFEGYGKQEDSFAPKRESWPLTSNGQLEVKLANSVREHFSTAR